MKSPSGPKFWPSVDVIVIGGGANGALITLELAKRGYSVIALEKGSLGNGSSSRSAACIRAQFDEEDNVRGMMYAEWFFENFYDQLGMNPSQSQEWIFQQNGYLFLYENPSFGQDSIKLTQAWDKAQLKAKMQQGLGLDVQILDGQEVHQRWPHIKQERIIGATFCNSDGFLNHDLVYQLAFARAKELGAQVLTNTEVLGAEHLGGHIVSLNTSQGDLSAKWIVNATNAWAPRLSRVLGGMELPIEVRKRYLYWVKPGSHFLPDTQWRDFPFTIFGMTSDRGAYIRPHHNELMFGWAHSDARLENDFSDVDQDIIEPRFHPQAASDEAYWMKFRLNINDFSETMAEAGHAQATSGYYAETPDRHPIIDVDTQVSNLIHAVGFSGHGLMMSPVSAQVVANIICYGGSLENGDIILPEEFRYSATLSCASFAANRDFNAHKEEQYI